MHTPGVTQFERARRLLAHEAATAGNAAGPTTAASRVYDRLLEQLTPLVGATGVQALFVRSAKLVQGEFGGVAQLSIFEGAANLRALLHSKQLAGESVVALFATFLTLITTFIGERLTSQVLRRAWPALGERVTPEEDP